MRPLIVASTGLAIALGVCCIVLDMLMRHFWAAAVDIFLIGLVIATGVVAFKVLKSKK